MEVTCPKCGSNQITANKKGFSGKKAVAGALLTGGVGLLAGTLGSNSVKITCLSCGNEFKPGDRAKPVKISSAQKLANMSPEERAKNSKGVKKVAKVFAPLFLILGLFMAFNDVVAFGIVSVSVGLFFLALALQKIPETKSPN